MAIKLNDAMREHLASLTGMPVSVHAVVYFHHGGALQQLLSQMVRDEHLTREAAQSVENEFWFYRPDDTRVAFVLGDGMILWAGPVDGCPLLTQGYP